MVEKINAITTMQFKSENFHIIGVPTSQAEWLEFKVQCDGVFLADLGDILRLCGGQQAE